MGQASKELLQLKVRSYLIIELSGTGVVEWFKKKNGSISQFLITCDKFRDLRGFNCDTFQYDWAGEDKSFDTEGNDKYW